MVLQLIKQHMKAEWLLQNGLFVSLDLWPHQQRVRVWTDLVAIFVWIEGSLPQPKHLQRFSPLIKCRWLTLPSEHCGFTYHSKYICLLFLRKSNNIFFLCVTSVPESPQESRNDGFSVLEMFMWIMTNNDYNIRIIFLKFLIWLNSLKTAKASSMYHLPHLQVFLLTFYG